MSLVAVGKALMTPFTKDDIENIATNIPGAEGIAIANGSCTNTSMAMA